MAKITRTLSRRTNTNGTSEIMLRVTISRTRQIRLKSGIFVTPSRFKDGRFIYPRTNQKDIATLHQLESSLQKLESAIIDFCISNDDVTGEMLKMVVDRYYNPSKYDIEKQGSEHPFFDTYNEFIRMRNISPKRMNDYESVGRILFRYEAYRRETYDSEYRLSVDGMTTEDVANILWFVRNEHTLYSRHPKYATQYPDFLRYKHPRMKVEQRGDNMVCHIFNIFKAFFNWCNQQDLTQNRPFQRLNDSPKENYGTPYYLTIEEREKISTFDLSEHPNLAVQRDIFIFQCLVGCRVSDLYGFEKDNISGNFLEYVPDKTSKERKNVVRVPLKQQAKDILERYRDCEKGLFPFASQNIYNDSIKEILKLCGIDRVVTVINPKTGKDERRPIYEVASSHMARRTFIGNLYKKVKDPNLIGSMSGHKEGSKAFARYREIDDDIKMDIIDLI